VVALVTWGTESLATHLGKDHTPAKAGVAKPRDLASSATPRLLLTRALNEAQPPLPYLSSDPPEKQPHLRANT